MRHARFRAFALLAVSLLVSLAFAPVPASLAGSVESRDAPGLAVNPKPPDVHAVDGVPVGAATFQLTAGVVEFGSTTNAYVYSGLSVVYETNPAAKYVFANGLRLGRIQGSAEEYYHYDHLGNVRLVTKKVNGGQNGEPVAALAYKPFGVAVVVSGSEPKYGYTGEYREAAPNLVYLHARWYDPTIGRFLSPDDRLGSLSMPQDQNRYAYVVNNPLAYTDPTGHAFWIPLLWLAAALFVTGTAAAVAAHYVPALRPVADAFAFVVGFIPVIGDAYAAGYFLTQDALDCANGRCDGTTIALDVLGIVPFVGDVGRIARGAKLADLMPRFARMAANADDAADLGHAAARAETRANEVHGVLHPIAQRQRTTAVLDSTAGRIVGGGVEDLTPAQRAALLPGEVPARVPGAHAEVTVLQRATELGARPRALGVSRDLCSASREVIERSGGVIIGPRQAVWWQ